MKRHALIILSLVLLAATVAEAQTTRHVAQHRSRAQRWDFSLQTRYTGEQSKEGAGGAAVEIADDLGWGFGFSYNFNQTFNLGMNFTWKSVPYVGTAIPEDPAEQPQQFSSTLSTSSFGLTGEWNILKGRHTPYVNAGVAWAIVDSNIFAGWGSGCWWYPYWGYVCGPVPLTYGANTTAGILGLGGRFEVSSGFYIRVGYEHNWTGLEFPDAVHTVRVDLGLML